MCWMMNDVRCFYMVDEVWCWMVMVEVDDVGLMVDDAHWTLRVV